MYVINFIRGFLMALADSVPGVSGGTIAFIMGFYNKFISIKCFNIYKKNWCKQKRCHNILIKIRNRLDNWYGFINIIYSINIW